MAEPAHTLVLEFNLSRDPDHDATVLRVARLLPGFDTRAPDAGRCRVACTLEQAAALRDVVLDLWEQVHGRPGAALLLDGKPLDLDGLRQALRILDCAQAYAQQRRGAAHCTPHSGWDWGCLYLADVPPQAGEHGLDRQALNALLSREANARWLSLCPHFAPDRVVANVDLLTPGNARSHAFGGTVAEAMCPDVFTVPQDMPLTAVLQHMVTTGGKRLVVVDGEGRLCGMVERDTILRVIGDAP